jgi:photosystem II protein|uniref:Photosystem II reaction center Psb28 protein n=2 Tax=Cyanidioschyzon merolae TaxID=45157 RepID=PSB28_CYAM1|nr:photosystem II protein W [Cyanidioschyzon merolae strain 10D]Q85G21.1 RecName: Full=Photosystem II reaction center Psb28 protein; AltName: Full=Photosystem II 13 kDa protein; AltName: Full=Photosystem II reaction center W protein [Cyanidioschyzon merolae strain 10D]QFV16969.1 photosystem II protein W [Cyanidioschyzon merolae]QFV17147.1 photosystem II protein W [Cyanidioschyzon merolae]BAC76170.1 photosystem II protein W [Cyanidioschyzon merolae strain 10D]
MASIQFIQGVDEDIIPTVRLTRSRDGQTGTAVFRFVQPKLLQQQGEITGMYMIDEEGEIVTREVQAKFVNGQPQIIEALYVMKNAQAWERFMRFMNRYAEAKGLSFQRS